MSEEIAANPGAVAPSEPGSSPGDSPAGGCPVHPPAGAPPWTLTVQYAAFWVILGLKADVAALKAELAQIRAEAVRGHLASVNPAGSA
jgi:hypothetical protein